MNDEEKKAIEILKNMTQDDLLDCWDQGEEEYNAIQTILNLIEKQQKEIEKLDKQNCIMRIVDKQYISKDKIKEVLIRYGGSHFIAKADIEELLKEREN